ncbi:hypothetical protein DH2020_033830 [Rehmannia glutinosa]|uniref:Uncharacterized protein n=1 Tax=Rehmannia glutinosa TaxID=99300 RepID=A0ABR0VDI2_REHGL
MVMSEEEITRLHRIRKTVMQILRDRGYMVGDFEIEMSRYQFLQKYGENMKREDLIINKGLRSNSSDQEAKVGVKTMKTYTNRMKEEGVHRRLFEEFKYLILVVQQNLTRSYVSVVEIISSNISEISSKFHLEVFQVIDVKEHVLIPEHQLLTAEEKKTLLERYTVKETQLPRIQITDPIARYYGLKRGQVVKIIRPSETAGRYVTYRYVV